MLSLDKPGIQERGMTMAKTAPSVDQWLAEAKADESAPRVGMYLAHNGVVRELPKKLVREGVDEGKKVTGMNFSYDAEAVEAARQEALTWKGVEYVRVWLNEGELQVGDDIMYVLIGGDRGLAGGYNSNVLKLCYSEMRGKDVEVLPIGNSLAP